MTYCEECLSNEIPIGITYLKNPQYMVTAQFKFMEMSDKSVIILAQNMNGVFLIILAQNMNWVFLTREKKILHFLTTKSD